MPVQSVFIYSRFTVHRYSKVLIIDPGTGIAVSWSSSTGAGTLRVKISVPVATAKFYMSMQNGRNVEKRLSQNFDFDFQFRETAAFVFQ